MNCREWRNGVACLLLLLAHQGIGRAQHLLREKMTTCLHFRVLDVAEDAGVVPAFRYSLTIESADAETIRLRDVDYQADDGILRVPGDVPPFGRIRVWIDADDLEKGYRHGYGSYSYRIDKGQSAEPATIQLDPGIVLTGKVLDAETGEPIAGAEVSPLKWGHHLPWADWDGSASTKTDGSFRVITKESDGIEARHPKYRYKEVESEAREFTVRLHPLVTLQARAVDADGQPIAGVSAGGKDGESAADGRFRIQVTRDEWNQREKRKIGLTALNYELTNVPLADFSLDGETVVTLKSEPVIRGRVLDENGEPLEDCKIELGSESEGVRAYFFPVRGPHQHGKWEVRVSPHDRVFTLRVSVAGTVRSLKEYSLEEVRRGPIITRLGDGHRLSGRLVTRVRLGEKNTPPVVLHGPVGTDLQQLAKVQADGSFEFFGLSDGKYILQLYPAANFENGGGNRVPGVGAFSQYELISSDETWEKSITIDGGDVKLDPINLHDTRLLPGRLTGVAYNPYGENRPFANGYGYLCESDDDFDSVGDGHYVLRFMTDADGRFQVDACPPGKHLLRLNEYSKGYCHGDPSVWIRVEPEKTLDMQLFGPGTKNQLAIDFVVGDGSSRHVHAAAGIDANVIAKYADTPRGSPPYDAGDGENLRFGPTKIEFELEALNEVNHWPLYDKSFVFAPTTLPKDKARDIVIPNVAPGRWRLTLHTMCGLVDVTREVLPPREFVFKDGMAPLQFVMPPAALAGTFANPERKYAQFGKIVAIPQQVDLPTRTCEGRSAFRFIGLQPGRYTVRSEGKGCETKTVKNVLVREGETTWLDDVELKSAPKKAGEEEDPDYAPPA